MGLHEWQGKCLVLLTTVDLEPGPGQWWKFFLSEKEEEIKDKRLKEESKDLKND